MQLPLSDDQYLLSCSKIEAESRRSADASVGGVTPADAHQSGPLADAVSGRAPTAPPRGPDIPLAPRVSTAGTVAASTAPTEPQMKAADTGGSLLDDVGALLEDTGRLLARLGASSAAIEGKTLFHIMDPVTPAIRSSRSSAILPLQHRPADPE